MDVKEGSIRHDGEMIRLITPLMFAFAEKTFKFVSWLIIIAAIRLAQKATGSSEFGWLFGFLVGVYTVTLLLTCWDMTLKGFPASPYIPRFFRWTIATVLFFLGMGLQMLLILPQRDGLLMLDHMIEQLTQVRDVDGRS
jgi:hypothetical protein